MESYRLDDLIRLAALTNRAFDAEDKLYAVTRAKAEQLLAFVCNTLLNPDLSNPNASVAPLAVQVMVDFGVEPPAQFSLIWFVQACEEALQLLHREMCEHSRGRDRRMATLHRQKFSELLGKFLEQEAAHIADRGLESSDDPGDPAADDLERQLRACVMDPLQVLWPSPVGGKPILKGWEGLADDLPAQSSAG